jgi:hypothetical protein
MSAIDLSLATLVIVFSWHDKAAFPLAKFVKLSAMLHYEIAALILGYIGEICKVKLS